MPQQAAEVVPAAYKDRVHLVAFLTLEVISTQSAFTFGVAYYRFNRASPLEQLSQGSREFLKAATDDVDPSWAGVIVSAKALIRQHRLDIGSA